jgi:hypothetical protein
MITMVIIKNKERAVIKYDHSDALVAPKIRDDFLNLKIIVPYVRRFHTSFET